MSQQDVVDLFVARGNIWLTCGEIRQAIGGSSSCFKIYRVADLLESSSITHPEDGRYHPGAPCVAHRLRPRIYNSIVSEREASP